MPLQVPQVLWQVTATQLLEASSTKPLRHWQTPPERKALVLHEVQVVEDPLQVAQVGLQAEQLLAASRKKPPLQTQMPPLSVAWVPEQPVHWLNLGPVQAEQLESQGMQALPSELGVNPVLQVHVVPAGCALATQVRHTDESAALQVAQRPEQVEQTPVAVFKKNPALQSHSLCAATVSLLWALTLQVTHWLAAVPAQVEQVEWQPAATQNPVESCVSAPLLHVQVDVPALKVESALQDKHWLAATPEHVAQELWHFRQSPVAASSTQPGLQVHWPRLSAALALQEEHVLAVFEVQVRQVLWQAVQAKVVGWR